MRFFGLKYILCAISLITLFALDAKGGGTEFYYKVTAKASAKGAGKVYARTDTEHGPWLFKDEISSRHYEAKVSEDNATETSIEEIVYLYAQAEEGFALSGWTAPNESTITTGNSYSFHLTSTNVGSPNNFVFTANFVDTYVSAFSANSDLCPVSVSPDINKAGDLVTITATPKSGVTILGWRIKGTSAIIAGSEGRNSIQVTATSSKITYEPVFNYSGTQLNFVKIQSKLDPSKFISIQQDEFSYTPIIYAAAGYSKLGSNKDYALQAALTFIKGGHYVSPVHNSGVVDAYGDFGISDNGIFDPGCIIYKDGGNFYGQGTNLTYMTKGYNCHHTGDGGIDKAHFFINGQTATFQSGGTFSMNPTVYYGGNSFSLGDIYLINDNGKLDVVTTSGTTDSYKWNQVPLDGNSQYFAFEPKLNDINGKYYATLRTGFSYKIKKPDIVKAYEVNEILQDGTVVKTPFADDEVIPGNLSVILESTSPEAIDNILLPYDITYTKQNSVLYNKYGTRLHCYTGEKSNNDQYDNCTEDGVGYFKVPYKGTSVIYKLGVNDAGDVGFFDKVNKNDIVSGNEGYSTQQCIVFEKIKTQPVIAFDREQAYINNAIQATITSDVEGAKIQYSLDGGETWNEYTAPISLSKGEEGEYPIMAKASKVGFVDSDVATAKCTFVKLTKPTISPESALAFFEQTNTITFTATNPNEDDQTTMKYRIDDGEWYVTPGVFTVTSNDAKEGTVSVKVVCNLSESESTTATYTFKSAYEDITLAELVKTGEVGQKYRIVDGDVAAVKLVDNDQLIVCKDDGKFAEPDDAKAEEWVDYMQKQSALTVPATYDQSNWIGLRLPKGTAVKNSQEGIAGHKLTGVKGVLTDKVNPELLLDEFPTQGDDATEFTMNVYVPASFYGQNHQTGSNGVEYFFVQPKPMELAAVEWGYWDGTKFVMPPSVGSWNQAGLSGEFDFNAAYLTGFNAADLQADHGYTMSEAIVRYKTEAYGSYDHIYVLGNVNGLNSGDWAPNKGVEMYTADGQTYTTMVRVDDAGGGYGYFSFSKKLGAKWEDISRSRFGAVSNGDFDVEFGQCYDKELSLEASGDSYKIPAGNYWLTITGNKADMTGMKLVITRVSSNAASAPRRAGEATKQQYVVYPLSLEPNGSSKDGDVITGVAGVTGSHEVAGVDYINLAGQRSSRPWQGVNIVVTRYTDGTTQTQKQVH